MKMRKRKLKIPKASETGLKCPLCGGHTLCRDVSLEDGWYVEVCLGGKLRFEDGEEVYEFSCPYWWAGFQKRG